MTKKHLIATRAVILLSSAAFAVSCSKKADDPAAPATTTTTATATGTVATVSTSTGSTSITSMLNAYPSDLALAIFTDDSSTSLRLAEEATEAEEKQAFQEAGRPLKERGEAQEKRLKGEVDDCVADALKRAPISGSTETCYEFDQDMILGGRSDGEPNGTKNGLNKDGVPCMVAFAKSRVTDVNDLLDRAQGMVSTMLCQAKKKDATAQPPAEVGGVLDLKAKLGEAMGAKAKEIVSAKIERLADVDSLPVYKSTVEMKEADRTRTVVLVHSPGADGTYHGTVYTIQHRESTTALALAGSGSGTGSGSGGAQAESKDHVLSVTYAKIKTDTGYLLQGDLIRANLAPDLVDVALGEDGVLDLSAFRDFSVAESDGHYGAAKKADGTYYAHNEDAERQTRITFSLDPATDAGTVSFAENPGSNYSEAARGMIAQVAVVDGVKKGCATSGAALGKDNLMQANSIAKSQKDGTTLDFIGFYHPQFDINPAHLSAGCSVAEGDDEDGHYYEKTCTGNQQGVIKWYEPKAADAVLAHTFATEQSGGIVTRQCYEYDVTAEAYKLDATEITDESGYQLVKNDSVGKLVQPPALNAKVKPFDGKIGKKED